MTQAQPIFQQLTLLLPMPAERGGAEEQKPKGPAMLGTRAKPAANL